MNLLRGTPFCVQDIPAEQKASMLVVSEFVGCSPSLSGAIRVNPWNVDSVADGIYSAIKMPLHDRHLRHAKHWRYVSTHTAAFWVKVCPAYTPRIDPPVVSTRVKRFVPTQIA